MVRIRKKREKRRVIYNPLIVAVSFSYLLLCFFCILIFSLLKISSHEVFGCVHIAPKWNSTHRLVYKLTKSTGACFIVFPPLMQLQKLQFKLKFLYNLHLYVTKLFVTLINEPLNQNVLLWSSETPVKTGTIQSRLAWHCARMAHKNKQNVLIVLWKLQLRCQSTNQAYSHMVTKAPQLCSRYKQGVRRERNSNQVPKWHDCCS